jgi:hypothetical protein
MTIKHKVIGSSNIHLFEKLLDEASLDGFIAQGGICILLHGPLGGETITYYHQLMVLNSGKR